MGLPDRETDKRRRFLKLGRINELLDETWREIDWDGLRGRGPGGASALNERQERTSSVGYRRESSVV